MPDTSIGAQYRIEIRESAEAASQITLASIGFRSVQPFLCYALVVPSTYFNRQLSGLDFISRCEDDHICGMISPAGVYDRVSSEVRDGSCDEVNVG